jgi:hypothetical protein
MTGTLLVMASTQSFLLILSPAATLLTRSPWTPDERCAAGITATASWDTHPLDAPAQRVGLENVILGQLLQAQHGTMGLFLSGM